MKVGVSYYRLGPNGMPNSPEQHAVVEIELEANADKDALVRKALYEKTYISEDKFKVIDVTEM